MRKGDRCTKGTWYTLGAENISRGAGSDQFVDPEALLVPSKTVLLTPDIKIAKNKKRHIERQVVLVMNRPRSTPSPKQDSLINA